jgi:hypothetical protein
MDHDDIATRLAAAEARIPVEAGPPVPADARRRRRSALALVAAPVLVLALAATAIAGAGAIGMIVGTTGSEPMDPELLGAGLECMTPPEAAAWLAANGYDQVVWESGGTIGSGTIQVGPEPSDLPVIDPGAGGPVPSLGAPEGSGRASTGGASGSTTPPEDGIVSPGPMIDGTLHMIVDTTPGAARPATCPAS